MTPAGTSSSNWLYISDVPWGQDFWLTSSF